MSEIIYGLISPVDKKTLEKCFDEIFEKFPDEAIRYTEVGIYHGRTVSGSREYFKSKNKEYIQIGIDNFKDKEELVFFPEDATLIQGSSIEVYNQLPDESQHFLLIDANHSKPYVMADALCYFKKVKIGGFICFHDAAPHAQDVSYQRMGSEDDMDMHISVLRALETIGWIGEKNVLDFYGLELAHYEYAPFEVDEGGGILAFRRIK